MQRGFFKEDSKSCRKSAKSCASICIYQSGFFITTNEMSNFGQELDTEAISTRLAVSETDSFHYCADVLKDEPLFSDNESQMAIAPMREQSILISTRKNIHC